MMRFIDRLAEAAHDRPRQAAAVVFATIAVVAVIVITMFGHGTPPELAAPPAPAATTPGPWFTSAAPAPTDTDIAAPDATDDADAETAALRFTQAWLDVDGIPRDAWLAGVLPEATDDFGAALKTTDPTRIPHAHVDGTLAVQDTSDDTVLVVVPLSNGTSVLVTVVYGSDGWLTSAIDPVVR